MDTRVSQWAMNGGRALASAVPRVVGQGVLGGVGGALGFGLVGLGLAVFSSWQRAHVPDAPAWLAISWVLGPVSLALAGAYAGTMRGLLLGLAKQLVEKRLVAHLYAVVKPVVAQTAKRFQGGAPSASGEVAEAVRSALDAEPLDTGAPQGFGDRLSRWLAWKSKRLLVLTVAGHLARAKDGASAVHELERFGLAKLEQLLVDSLEDLFAVKRTVVLGLAFLVAIAPELVWAVLR